MSDEEAIPSSQVPTAFTLGSPLKARRMSNQHRALLLVPKEMSVFGDYPTQGWRYWAFMTFVVALGIIGFALMFAVTGGTAG